jgi:uncharacterized protein DUF6610
MCHGRPTLRLARKYGWLPGARYTNLRDIRGFDTVGLIDVDWNDYSFARHLDAVRAVNPLITVARDFEHTAQFPELLEQVEKLREHCRFVVIVPKTRAFGAVRHWFTGDFHLLGYSMPTGYGKTTLPRREFGERPVHLLGGRPIAQFEMSRHLNVFSLDCNSITIDAGFGKFFDGSGFRKHRRGGFLRCVASSLAGINALWERNHND